MDNSQRYPKKATPPFPQNYRPAAELRRDLFVDEYFKCQLNATKAVIAAGYSASSASMIGTQLLKDPYVVDKINERSAEIAKRNAISIDKMIVRLWEMFDFDTGELYDENGCFKRISDMSEMARKMISSCETESVGPLAFVSKVKFPDRIAAGTLLAKLLGYVEKVQIGVVGGKANGMAGVEGAKHIVEFYDPSEDVVDVPYQEVVNPAVVPPPPNV